MTERVVTARDGAGERRATALGMLHIVMVDSAAARVVMALRVPRAAPAHVVTALSAHRVTALGSAL